MTFFGISSLPLGLKLSLGAFSLPIDPEKKITEITKLISVDYKKLSKAEIDKYEEIYKKNKVTFEKDKK